ncbi:MULTISPECIES: diguanylate cyclase domain-containing protein [unclassified Crossiella]|uniref:diguanylate cyclase domain-containing protein n=1 Tax=unclassified Crossiella TaxID=2620835 RepID=UPI001FFED732|nr:MULTISPECIES: GGDEF domain-containing protein [unclassified Crossiella]MCK2240004.1 GGDEF domain-containing protein [Crossiella sp. S99.2]MCK2252712.1 GGDEF domain-containing protein [Crossiella sp. S99.1]
MPILLANIALGLVVASLIVILLHRGEHAQRCIAVLHSRLYAAQHDPLTGLPLRGLWRDTAVESIATMSQPVVLFADVNGLKQANDRYNHATGDALLNAFAAALRANFGRTAVIGRLAGDEFIILLDAHTLDSDQIRLAVTRCTVDGAELNLTHEDFTAGAAFGMAISRSTNRTPATVTPSTKDCDWRVRRLMTHADDALKDAKALCHSPGYSQPTALTIYKVSEATDGAPVVTGTRGMAALPR